MRALIRWGIDQSVLMNVFFVGVIIFAAAVAVPSIPVDRYPNISFGEVEITTPYPGAAPEEVEVLVTREIEDALRDMTDLDWVRATSKAGLSMIRLKFLDDTDYDGLYDELRLRVLSVQNRMPRIDGQPVQPQFKMVEVDEWLPVIQVNLVAGNPDAPLDQRALGLMAEQLRTRLEAVPGVKRLEMLGDVAEQFDLVLDPSALERHRVTMAEVTAALGRSGGAMPAGTLSTPLGERQVRIDTRYRSPADAYSVVVRLDGDGTPVTVGELIDPALSGARPVDGAVAITVNGQETVAARVLKLQSASAPDVKDGVIAATEEFLAAHPDGRVAAVYTEDNTIEINDGMGVLAQSLILSVILVMVILFIFLANKSWWWNTAIAGGGLVAALIAATVHSGVIEALVVGALGAVILVTCRAAVLTVSGIAFAFLGALVVFWLGGQSLNEITLLGFVLVSGIIVDDAIVVLENIQRHREEGKPLLASAVDGTAEVFWPVVSATITTMCAFLPMLLMTGSVGEFFALVPIAVSTALAISLLEALIILPLHVVEVERVLGPDRSLERHGKGHDGLPESGILGWMARRYDAMLRFNLRRPVLTIFGSALLFVLAVGVLVYSAVAPKYEMKPILRAEFFPEDLSQLMLTMDGPLGTSLDVTDQRARQVAAELSGLGRDKVYTVTAIAGMTMDPTYKPLFDDTRAMLMVKLPPREERSFADASVWLVELRQLVEDRFERDGWSVELRAMPNGPPTGLPVNVRITGVDEAAIHALAADLKAWMQAEADGGRLDGVIDLADDGSDRNAVIAFRPDRERVAGYGFDEAGVQRFVATAVEGAYVGEFRRSDGDIPIRVRMPDAVGSDLSQLLDLPIVHDPGGRVLRFGDLGSLGTSTEAATLIRRDFQRTITITGDIAESSNLSANTVAGIIDDWYQQRAADYPGASIAFGGEAESTAKSYRSLGIAFALAMLLIYGVLAAQFKSYLQPLLIMSNIAFSFTGVVLVMGLLGIMSQMLEGVVRPERALFTVNSFIAIIGLAGLVVNDAIVLIDFINLRRRAGMPCQEAVILAAHQRMRPIALTTLTTIAGLLPMAIGVPEFSITWGPFATSFITGLSVSTLMTLLVVPVLYSVLDRLAGGTTGMGGHAADPSASADRPHLDHAAA